MLATGGSVDWSEAKEYLQKANGIGFPRGSINWLPSRNTFDSQQEGSDDAESNSDGSD